jgi:mono/diheme cytochrome c family protein
VNERLRIAAALVLTLHPVAWADGPGVSIQSRTSTADGETIYKQICQGCHMPDGEGAVGAGSYPKLAGNVALASWQYVALTVLNGRSNMPAFGVPEGYTIAPRSALLSDAQIAAVVSYLRSHFGNHYRGQVTTTDVETLPHPRAVAHP